MTYNKCMSGGEKQQSQAGKSQSRWRRIRVVAGVLGLLLAGLITLSFGLRSPVVLSHTFGTPIAERAAQSEIDLQLGAMSGVGWTGVRLHDVNIETRRESLVLSFTTPQVDVYPDVGASLRARRPVIRLIEIHSIDLEAARCAGHKSGESQASEPAADELSMETWFAEKLRIEVQEATATVAELEDPVVFDSLAIGVDPQRREVTELEGSADFRGMAFDLRRTEEALVASLHEPRLDRRFAELPFKLELQAVALGHEAVRDVLYNRHLDELGLDIYGLKASTDRLGRVAVTADRSHLRGDESALHWSTSSATVDGGDKAYQMRHGELGWREDAGGFEFYTEIEDGQGGSIELQGQWHIPTSLVGINAWIHNFRWDETMPWPFDQEPPIPQGRLDGALHGDADLVHGLVSLDGELHFSEVMVSVPILSNEPVLFENVDVALPLTVDTRGRALSVVNGEIRVGTVGPFAFDGTVIDAGGGSHVYDMRARAESIDAAKAADQLPPEVTGMISETEMTGEFGAGLEMAGHSAYPESLVLAIDFWGDVEVLEEAQWHDGDVLRAQEVLVFDREGHPRRSENRGEWRELAELPTLVPAAVLAAEDAAFFEHDGLDWKGLRMAMVENIQERALVRGGSTITQQVAKNLFLTHDRTLFRKFQEGFLTWRVEETLTKEEILELYLNVVEWGPNIQGVAGAAQYFFDKQPEALQPIEMVVLASILPNPVRFGAAIKEGYMPSSRADKVRRVLENMRFVEDLSWPQYHEANDQLEQRQFGALSLQICADDESAPQGAVACADIEMSASPPEEPSQRRGSTGGLGWIPLTH